MVPVVSACQSVMRAPVTASSAARFCRATVDLGEVPPMKTRDPSSDAATAHFAVRHGSEGRVRLTRRQQRATFERWFGPMEVNLPATITRPLSSTTGRRSPDPRSSWSWSAWETTAAWTVPWTPVTSGENDGDAAGEEKQAPAHLDFGPPSIHCAPLPL